MDTLHEETRSISVSERRDANGNGRDYGLPPAIKTVPLKRGRQVDPDPNDWQLTGDKRPFGRDPATLGAIKAIRDLDPQAAHAVWNFLRLVNPGHQLLCISTDAIEGREEDYVIPAGQKVLDDLAMRVGWEYGGGLDQLHNVLALMVISYGAVSAECAPTKDLSDTEDWYPIDPKVITFKRDKTTRRLLIGHKVQGKWEQLPEGQVFYQPLDPDVDDPYGRPPLLPAIHSTMAKAQMLNDLRAVAHNQGYPRVDIELDWEKIKLAAPPHLLQEGREADFRAWAAKQLDSIAGDLSNIAVDDTFVHFDWVHVGMVGPNYAASSFDFKGFEQILTRQLQASLKTLPILLGINDSTSETHGSIQWQIQVAAVLQLQRQVKRVIERLASVSLRLAGIQGRAKMVYDEIRAIDRRYEAEAEEKELANWAYRVQLGWETNDAAAEHITGHPAVDEPLFDSKNQYGDQANDPENKEPDRNTKPEQADKD